MQSIWQALTNSTPHWNDYVQWSLHPSNDSTVQKINQAETDHTFLHLSKGKMGSELHPAKELSDAFMTVGRNISYAGYGDGRGKLSLRKALSHHLASRCVSTSPDSVLIVSGSHQALQLISLGGFSQNQQYF
ncbi:hypothetical protein [Halobacillus amylolyticus]|uniref:Uncharacterized protein n=1 Tax=Halobacillus amylolyticus TaxID=2932259 RepID=A0ABY4HE23_9BACI|nr:hypothetical protein [Halobacillus amylolyticus]UOR12889.1 hypothetical protein MUO15_05105 [Halobacillus amylolyticus]